MPWLTGFSAGLLFLASACQAGDGHDSAAPRCGEERVSASVREADMYRETSDYFENVRIVFTNFSVTDCVIEGPPEAVLTGPATAAWRQTFVVPSAGAAAEVVLAPGRSASSTVRVLLEPDATDMWQPDQIEIAQVGSIAWPDGLCMRQDATPRPGIGLPVSISPFTPDA
ncbi:DUF4232 domain-containing protein [Actinoplanes sp. NPDC051494]|uniref:DUF4232 domain-containing protein n=1 Tax=Actinoplanes sp. NPDC051494 TaxID=3363907 RepID=UPI003799791F